MDVSLDGYRFDRRLRHSAASEVWSAVRESDGLAVIAKVFSIEDRVGLEARVEHEFGLIRRLDLPGVVRALDCVRRGRLLYLLLEGHEGVELAEYAGGEPLALDAFFSIACELTATLVEVHARRVIHRDIKPTNVLVDVDGGNVVLADFGISVLLESERGHLHDPAIMRGTLPYASPEQTGRIGREVDFRSDLYSLGATFYELLTGRRPFEADSPLELIHAHLARRPEPPQRIRRELPTALSRLVMKLLEKAPERRYQSARGLLEDLREMREGHGRGTLGADFELARRDVPLALQLPHQLYGRGPEQAQLRAALRRASEGPPVFCVIVGEAGAGKSALIGELAQEAIGRGGWLLRGKFEAGRDEPLSALLGALTGLAEQFLTVAPEQLAEQIQRLRAELASLTALLVELVPRFGALFDDAPEAEPGLASDRARNRVHQACVRLLESVAHAGRPIILALDDLQWADAATLEVLDKLSTSASEGLLVVLAARPEGREATALAELQAKLARHGDDRLQRLVLRPLDLDEIVEMLSDALSLPREEVAPLAAVVARKTEGNPFFARQFILHLGERGLIRRGGQRWTWALDELARASLPADALDMMTRKLARLDGPSRELIQAGAILGETIEPTVLAGIVAQAEVTGRLLELVDDGLLAPGPAGSFVFAHQRIREAAYAMVEVDRRRRWHQLAGQRMAADPVRRERDILGIAEHLDRGHGLWSDAAGARAIALDEDARASLAGLNLGAGRRALGTGAPAAALRYLEIAAGLAEASADRPALDWGPERFEVELRLAQAEALTVARERADARIGRLLDRELAPAEFTAAAVVRCNIYIAHGQIKQAVEFGLEVLAKLDVAVPPRPTAVDVARLMPRLVWMVRPAGVARLAELEPVSEPWARAAMDLLTAIAPMSYAHSPEMFVVLAACQAELVLAHGAHPSMPSVFARIGLVLANALGRRRQAVSLHASCAAMVEDDEPALRIGLLGLFLRSWAEPLRGLVAEAGELLDRSLALGDLGAASVAGINLVWFSWHGGEHLRVVEARLDTRTRWMAQWGVSVGERAVAALREACDRLMRGLPESGEILIGALDEELSEGAAILEYDRIVIESMILGVYGRWAAVFDRLEGQLAVVERVLPGTWYLGPAHVLAGVACAELARELDGRGRRAMLRKLAASTSKLEAWAAGGGNVGHLAALLEAEHSVIRGDLDRAARYFERARAGSLAGDNPIYAALASERLAIALSRAGHGRLAIGPLLDAREHYSSWGAFAKVRELEERWPELSRLSSASADPPVVAGARPTRTSSTNPETNRAIDTSSLLQAAQTLAEDLRLPEVIGRVMRIALENAGAQRCVLMLAAKGKLSFAAELGPDGELEAQLAEPPPLSDCVDRVPASLLRYVLRTGEALIANSPSEDGRFGADPYFRGAHASTGAVLCLPIIKRGRPVGLLYFENQISEFGPERLEILHLLAGHAGGALENARLYENLRDSEIRWRSLVDQLPDYVILVRRDGGLEYINAAARPSLWGAGQFDAQEFVAGPSSASVRDAITRVLGGGAQEQLEVQVEMPGSGPRWYAVRVAPIAIDGAIDRVIVVSTDVDDHKRAEAERDRFEGQLREQQRLDSIGTLASGVAHEINNPVQGIMNYAELIGGSAVADDMIREFAIEIEHETQRVATIVRHLLAFARQESSEAGESTALDDVIEGSVSLVRAVMRRDQIRMSVEISEDLPKVVCRRQQIQQVVMNLVTNARDALNVRFRGYDEDKRLEIVAVPFEEQGEPWVRISVHDHGGGVPAEVVTHIYDPFFTSKGRDQGTGLGLSVSHGIVSEHGGRLTLVNEPGVGATFCVELPCEGPTASAGRPPRGTIAARAGEP